MSNGKPCCAAEALRRIRQIPVNGIMTGITMLDESMKKIRIYNYIPPGVAGEYTRAIMEEYRRAGKEKKI